MTDIWNSRREQLEQAFVKAALDLAQHTGAESFTVPIKGYVMVPTEPDLAMVIAGENYIGRHAYARMIAAAPAIPLPAAPVQGWVSVKDRLPEVGQGVLAYRPTAEQTQDPAITITFYTGRMKESWQGIEHGFDCLCHPTHWMPLPTLPPPPVGENE